MNLCNIHFHNAAEHKALAFSIEAHKDKVGGYQCGISQHLTDAELKPYENNSCKGVEVGDTVEYHWVYSTCTVKPGPELDSCFSKSCLNPNLRVETAVFTVVNDESALNFADFDNGGQSQNGFYQAKSLPTGIGTPVEFLGSTTGPHFNDHICSPAQVSWSVRPECAKVSIASLSNWCASNDFDEDHAHGVRKLVTDLKLLSPIK
ncbi:MAG: hypothetical protein JKY19_07140 [Alcanivoracaceae bacterium]|nr:hypothetical protein [Alcanivoracaceae bacterium]